MTDRRVRVLPDVPALRRTFDYSVPDRLADGVTVGARVRVELHGRRVAGWVTAVDVDPTPGVDARPLAASSGMGPPPSVVRLAEWAAWRWDGPVSSFLGTASPPRVVRSLPKPASITAPPASPGGGAVELVDAALGAGTRPVVRLPPALDALLVVEEVVHRVGTEGVLVLAPSRRRAGAAEARLRRRGVPVAVMPDEWDRVAAGGVVTVGTRVAAWAPLPAVRAVVVLDAHDETYREQRTPTWSAVDVVVERARRDGGVAVLLSPCPTVALSEGTTVVSLPRTLERRGWPRVEVVDRREDDPRTGLFSDRLRRATREVLDRPEGRVVAVLNRTGRVPLLACRHCGAVARCTRCGAAVAMAAGRPDDGGAAAGDGERAPDGATARDAAPLRDGASVDALVCRRCGDGRPVQCAVCDDNRFRALRMGVTRAAEELSALVGEPVVELTAEHGTPDAEDARLVVGTEAALHRLRSADLVAVLDFDQHLLAPRFGAAEESLALLVRAARLLGPRERDGRLLVQTRLPDHEAVRAAVRADPELLTASERAVRAELRLPPFGALALLRGPGAGSMAAELAARSGLSASEAGPDRRLVRADRHEKLCDSLAAVPRPAERVRVEVDPVDV